MAFIQDKIAYDGKVWQIRFPDGDHYTVKYLTYKEHLLFSQLYEMRLPAAYIDYEVCKHILVNPKVDQLVKYEDDLLAGVYTTIADLAMYISGNHYSTPEGLETFQNLLSTAREMSNSIDEYMFAAICSTFPAYKYEDLYSLPFSDIVKLFAAAESLMIRKGILSEYSQIGMPGQEPAPAKRPKISPRVSKPPAGHQPMRSLPEQGKINVSEINVPSNNRTGEKTVQQMESSFSKDKPMVIPTSQIKAMNAAFEKEEIDEAERITKAKQEAIKQRALKKKEFHETGEWRDYNYIDPKRLKESTKTFNKQFLTSTASKKKVRTRKK